jgi:hypothetical protein
MGGPALVLVPLATATVLELSDWELARADVQASERS